jgi:lipopolysaccharide/colanic/teichoic acid biosynthesis glycosyltransferase
MMRVNEGLKNRSEFQLKSFYAVSPWCESALKRGFDVFGAIFLLILLSPLMIAVAVLVKLTSRGPVLFRQRRPGKNGDEFTILKFRTMIDNRHHEGPFLTCAADPRVTPFGRFIRKWKLDEFPQLFNVLRGEMSFVGPRPQPTNLWQQSFMQEEASCVLSVRPGITSQATVKFRNEEELLAPFSSERVEEVYMRAIMPVKMKMNLEYLESASFTSDFRIILTTIFRVFNRQEGKNDFIIRELLPVARQEEPLSVQERKEYLPAAEEAD